MGDKLYAFRADTADQWAQANPLIPVGVPCFEIDTHQLKIGDGNTRYVDLDYFTGTVVVPVFLDDTAPRLDATYTSQNIESRLTDILGQAQEYTDGAVQGGTQKYPVSAAQQLQDGTWPNRPNCDVAMALGYPGRTDPPGWLVSPSDIYFAKST